MPFVRLFYGQPSQYLWADDTGTVHHVDQGDGGLPLLFSLGQHAALQAVQRQLAEGELLFTFLDDVYAELYVTPASASMGAKPNCGIREASAQIFAMFWRSWGRGSDLPPAQQGVTVLGTMVHDYAERHNAGLWRCLVPQQVCTPMMVRQLSGVDDCESPSLQAASRAARELTGVEGFEVPSCVDALVRGARPPPHEVDEQALLRSQSEPMAGIGSLPALPTSLPASNPTFSGWSCCAVSVFLSPSLCVPVVVAIFDSLGHHRAACARTGVLGTGICNRECCHLIVPRRRRTSCFVTWTFQCLLHEVGGSWRSSLTVFHYSEAPSSLWTPHWDGAVLALARRPKERAHQP